MFTINMPLVCIGEAFLLLAYTYLMGAILRKITVRLYDNHDFGMSVTLMGFNVTAGWMLGELARVETYDLGKPGNILLYDGTINYAVIDNKNCIYAITAYFG